MADQAYTLHIFAGEIAAGAIPGCPPLKINNGSGSPLRVLVLVDRRAS